MTWREQLRKAKFRGVEFQVLDRDLALGRRTITHEYPKRDKPYVEDLGRKAREFTLEAYVIAADYLSRRDALIRELEKPGAGTLVHPTFGALQVTLTQARVRESSREGGMARFSLTFVEAGEAAFPVSIADTPAKTQAAADAALTATETSFAKAFSVKGRPAYVSLAAQTLLGDAAERIRTANGAIAAFTQPIEAFASLADEIATGLVSLVLKPTETAGQFRGLMSAAASVASSPRAAIRGYRSLRAFGDPSAELGTGLEPVPATTPNRVQQQRNQDAIINLVRQGATIEACRQSAKATFDSYDEAVAVRDQLGDDLDAEMVRADDPLYVQLVALRAAMVTDINRRGADLARIRRHTPRATVPALVLAHRLYGDASRAEELVARNRIRHPGFVPGGQALEVLTDG